MEDRVNCEVMKSVATMLADDVISCDEQRDAVALIGLLIDIQEYFERADSSARFHVRLDIPAQKSQVLQAIRDVEVLLQLIDKQHESFKTRKRGAKLGSYNNQASLLNSLYTRYYQMLASPDVTTELDAALDRTIADIPKIIDKQMKVNQRR